MATQHPLEIEHLTEDEANAHIAETEQPVAVKVTTGLGRTFNLRITPLDGRPILIAVHL